MFEARAFVYSIVEEIEILKSLQNAGGITFKEIHTEGISYYGVIAQLRDWEKQGLTTNIDGILGITERGSEYLNQLLISKKEKS